MKRLTIINPNTSADITTWLFDEARRVAPDDWSIEAVNADSGLAALETPEHVRIASEAVLATLGTRRADAAVIAAFGDPGLDRARASGFTVAGLGEAGLRAAASGRFAIVTLGEAMRGPILARVAALGFADRLVDLRVLEGGIAAYAADREARLRDVALEVEACAAIAAERVLLGGAPFAGQAARLKGLSAHVLDGVESAIREIAN